MNRVLNFNRLILCGGMALAVSLFARSAEVKTVDTDVVFNAAYTEDFDVDGKLGAPVWRIATPIAQMRDNRYPKVDLPKRADLRFAYSKTALYFGGTVWQDMKTAVYKWDQHDLPIWNDDNVELDFFLEEDDGAHVYQIIMNPMGAVGDLRNGNINWNADGIVVRTERFGDRWTIEVKLPFASLGLERQVSGDFIAARVCRWLHAQGAISHGSTPILINTGNEQRGRFAKLSFAEPTGANAAALIAADRVYKADSFRRKFYKRYDRLVSAFAEISAMSAAFASSRHPLHVRALDAVDGFRKTLADFQAGQAAALAAHQPVPQVEAETLFAAWRAFERTAADMAYVMWETSPWQVGSPRDMPAADASLTPGKIAFEQAGNEREQVCFNLHGLLCGARLDLRLWPETLDENGQFLSSDNFEVYLEPFVDIEGETVTMPLVRTPGNVVTVSPGRTVRVWIVFNSRGVKAGTYATALKVKPLSRVEIPVRALPLTATVWNFDLPETRDWPIRSFFWGAFSFHNDEVALMELMHDCHVTHAWTQFHRYRYGLYGENSYWKAPNRGKGKVESDHDFDDEVALHGNQAFLDRAKELGMRFVIGWGTPTSLAWFQLMTRRFLDMGFAYEDFTYKGLLTDEFLSKDIPVWARRREEVWNWNTNLSFQATLLSTPPPNGPSLEEIEAAGLPKFFRNWTVIRGLTKDPDRGARILSSLRRHGCKIWSYECSHFMHKQDILDYYRLYPWEARMSGLDGFAIWTIYSPKRDGWDSRDGFDDGVCWRGLDTKPVPTKQLEAVREGLEDVAYMHRLETECVRLKAKGVSVAEAEKLLDERQTIVVKPEFDQVDAWRNAVGRLIDRMARQ